MYHKGDPKGESKLMRLRAILNGGFAPKWLPLPPFTGLPRAEVFSETGLPALRLPVNLEALIRPQVSERRYIWEV